MTKVLFVSSDLLPRKTRALFVGNIQPSIARTPDNTQPVDSRSRMETNIYLHQQNRRNKQIERLGLYWTATFKIISWQMRDC
ncbi:MAG: hypothetical protein J7647_23915 [Cyanobacteria bacterium SBLK]|nr:hypothetical protein [Cyanobacteria bacterium SBLK]